MVDFDIETFIIGFVRYSAQSATNDFVRFRVPCNDGQPGVQSGLAILLEFRNAFVGFEYKGSAHGLSAQEISVAKLYDFGMLFWISYVVYDTSICVIRKSKI